MTWIKLNWIDQNSLDPWHTHCRCSYLIIRWTPASLGFLPVIFSFSRQANQELKDIVRWPGNWLFTINKSITRLVSALWNLAFLFSLSLLCLLHYKTSFTMNIHHTKFNITLSLSSREEKVNHNLKTCTLKIFSGISYMDTNITLLVVAMWILSADLFIHPFIHFLFLTLAQYIH